MCLTFSNRNLFSCWRGHRHAKKKKNPSIFSISRIAVSTKSFKIFITENAPIRFSNHATPGAAHVQWDVAVSTKTFKNSSDEECACQIFKSCDPICCECVIGRRTVYWKICGHESRYIISLSCFTTQKLYSATPFSQYSGV